MKGNHFSRKGPWFGRGLLIDLLQGKAETLDLPGQWGREYLGGPGLAARLLYEKGNQYDQVISSGLFVGLPVYTATKTSICGVSPLTGRWGESSVGGKWPVQIKRAGWDLIQLRGNSPEWVVIRIEDDRVHFEPANDLLGMSPGAVEEAIRDKWGLSYRVAAIGLGAERGVRFAGICASERWAGRCGMGHDWAARKLKAIAVSGSEKVHAFSKGHLQDAVRAVGDLVRERTGALHNYGTAASTVYRETLGAMPIKNFIEGKFPGAEKIAGQALVEAYHARQNPCPQCPISCGKHISVPGLDYQGPQPEYETVASLGALLLIDVPEAVVLGNRACNEYGLDTITAGVVIAFAIEAYERGFLSRKDFGRTEPAWGSAEFMLEMIDLISRREGVGDLLAEGVRGAAVKLGPGAMDFAVHAHGLELPMQDPRAFVSLGLTYAVSPRGASHTESMSYYVEQGFELADMGYPEGLPLHDAKGKGEMVATMQDIAHLYDNLGLCKFLLVAGIGPTTLMKWVNHAAGWDMEKQELLRCGTRSVTIKHFFNIDRLGIRPSPNLSKRVLVEPRAEGGSAGVVPDLEPMVADYYRARAWSPDGYPPDSERPAGSD